MAQQLLTDISFLHLVCSTPDVRFVTIRKDDQFKIINYVGEHEDEFLSELPSSSFELELFMSQVKTALILQDWISETPEDRMLDRYNVGSGDIYSVVSNAEWLLYATSEIAKLLGHSNVAAKVSVLHERVINGIRSDLVDLVQIPGIGRVRARSLFNKGYKTQEILKQTDPIEIINIPGFGTELVRSIYSHLMGDKFVEEKLGKIIKKKDNERNENFVQPQRQLEDFF
jgi:helicase